MSTSTITAPSHPVAGLAPSGLVGGIGGFLFVASVVVQNVLRAGFPSADAGPARVAAAYADHRSATLVLAALFPLGALGLCAFLGALLSRLLTGRGRAAALAGGFGAAGLIATYTMLLATDLALAGVVARGGAGPATIDGLWVLHNAIFGVLLAAIGVTVVGFSAASAAHELLPGWWKKLGLVGGLLLLTAAATTPSLIEAGPTMVVGLAGFLVWLAFVLSAGIKLLRSPEPTA